MAAQFAATVNVVEVYATVTDARGAPVMGLTRDQFEVFEDGIAQRIDTFVEGDFPLSVALAIDRSWSMAGERLELARRGARTFLDGLRPEDQAMVLAIGSEVETVAPLSTDRPRQASAIAALDPWGTSPIYDAVIGAVASVQAGRGRRALVLLSDGSERFSSADPAELIETVRRSDVLIYPIALGKRPAPLFGELAARTGGRSFVARDWKALESALATIANELRQQYLIGYTPTRPLSEAGWRAITVQVPGRAAVVRAREGYLVP